jgi:uncharacterized protein YceK
MNKKTIAGVSTILASTILLSGCASIVSKSQYPVSINSYPDGATVTVMNKSGITVLKAKTPTTVTLKASRGFFQPESYTLTYEKDGYQKQITTISAGLDGWYVGNIIFGGLIGILIVDPATGAMWRLDDSTTASLSETVADNKSELKVMNISQVPEEWQDNLVQIK